VKPLNTWSHIAFTYGSKMYNIYFNGNFDGSGNTTEELNNTIRMYNYIGRSSDTNHRYINSIIDELKIFNKVLIQREIQFEMNNQI